MSLSPSFLRAALGSGAIIGVLDALAATAHAYAFVHIGPDRVFRFVASGALGRTAFTGGAHMIAVGLAFHFLIAIAWTTLFFLLARTFRLPLSSAPTAAALGAFYGLAIWLAMNLVVIPLSKIPARPLALTSATMAMILIHVIVIGVPIALLARRHLQS
jgi:uncharacterized membrane protein YagU involved in acid resistance